MYLYRSFSAFLLFFVVTVAAFGQAARSPYSALGIGEPYGNSLIHNQGMAGVGVAQPQYWFLNNQNPALLVYNYNTVFEAGMIGEQRVARIDTASQKSFNGNLNYLATAFPIMRMPDRTLMRWTSSLGLMPFTNVNYRIKSVEPIENSDSTLQVSEQGTGGLTQLYWSNGVRLTRNLSLGLKATYVFSSITDDYTNQYFDPNQIIKYVVAVEDQTYVHDFLLTGGLSYSKDSLFNRDYRISLGATYRFGGNLRARRRSEFQRRSPGGVPLSSDTLTSRLGNIFVPPSLVIGAAFSKGSIWSIATELTLQDWEAYRSMDNGNDGLGKMFGIALGGEVTPDPFSDKWLKRLTYRVGVSYEKTPFLVENPANSSNFNEVKDFGINFGLSIPAGRTSFSSLNMAFRVGKRGSISDTILEESYFKVYFGITFNDQWFIRRKFD